MATCPNKAHPDWKSLVAKVGEKGANLAYVKNGFEIPRQDGLKQRPKKINVKAKAGFLGRTFSFSNTMDSMENHPEVAAQMIDELKSLFPEIRVFKDKIIDENGKYLEIPSDKQGRHYRNAFLSAVAWSNDSSVETPPHEYAHEYIDMYRNHPYVKEAIEKYGEEQLVTLIGKKYAGRKMSNSFEKVLAKIWKAIRRTFRVPSMVDILTDSFAKNEMLGEQFSRGTEAVHNYQDANAPLLKNKTAFNYNSETEKASDTIHYNTNKEARAEIKSEIFGNANITQTKDMVGNLNAWFTGLIKEVSSVTRMDGGVAGSSNLAPMDNSLARQIRSVIEESVENQTAILEYIREGKTKLTKEQELALKNIETLYIGKEHRKLINESYVSTETDQSQIIKEDTINEIGTNEVSETLQKKARRLAKKGPIFKWVDSFLTDKLKWVTNPRLWVNYISGSENSVVSRLLYKGLNDGRSVFSEFSNKFQDHFTSKPTSFYEGSIFHNPKASIEELETKSFDLDQSTNTKKSVELTKAEMLSIYLTSRQKGGINNLKEGVFIKPISGRISSRKAYKLTDSQLKEIINDIQSDSQAQELVAEIDAAMSYNHNELNKTFKMLEGFDLEQIENYFPMHHGFGGEISKSKNVIEDMRNLRLRTSDGLAVRLEDPFKVLAGLEVSNASYVAYAIPIHNAKKMIKNLEDSELNQEDMGGFIESLKGTIDRIQDNSLLYSTQGDTKTGKMINKIQGNFAVALLAYNPGVIFKQSVSLITAESVIDGKYIRRSGANIGIVSLINPVDLFKRLTLSGNSTMLPVEWKQIEDNEIYQTLMKYPMFRDRFSGMISRETGEAVMGRQIHDDLITVPFKKGKDGKPLKISKSRLMTGITMMDSLTIMRLYAAVELETQDRMGEAAFSGLTKEEIELHNINRLQEIIDKTQPTFDQTNRSGAAANPNPILRVFTMFSSATQKLWL
jgi:hypothetical protein